MLRVAKLEGRGFRKGERMRRRKASRSREVGSVFEINRNTWIEQYLLNSSITQTTRIEQLLLKKYFPMTETTADRARLLVKLLGPKKTSLHGGDYDRWRSISKGAIRVSTDEIDVLVKLYPQYALWLVTGTPEPNIRQVAPGND